MRLRFFETLTTIVSELDVYVNIGSKVIKNNSLSDFVRMSLSIDLILSFHKILRL